MLDLEVKFNLDLDTMMSRGFYNDLHEAIQPEGKVVIDYKDDDAKITIKVPYNYRILFESFIEKHFGKKGLNQLYKQVHKYEDRLSDEADKANE